MQSTPPSRFRTAARLSAGFAVGALLLFVVSVLAHGWAAGSSEVYGRAFVTLCALGVCVSLLVSLACGVAALCGLQRHGRSGILAPALLGLILTGLMLFPILRSLHSGMAAQAREPGSVPATTTTTAPPLTPPVRP